MIIQSTGFSVFQTSKSRIIWKHRKICLISSAERYLLIKSIIHSKIMKKTKIL